MWVQAPASAACRPSNTFWASALSTKLTRPLLKTYSKYGGTEVAVNGEDLLVLNSRDVLAVVEN